MFMLRIRNFMYSNTCTSMQHCNGQGLRLLLWDSVGESGSKGKILGEFQHSLDAKGRLALPAKYRGVFSERAVVTRGFEKCLVLYPGAEWDAWADKVGSLPTGQSETRQLMRLVFSGALECELDRLNRINIPAYLRQYAGLQSDTTLVGMGNRLEIWDRDQWTALRTAVEADGERIAAGLARFGL